jgi:Fe-S-cluster containining protein
MDAAGADSFGRPIDAGAAANCGTLDRMADEANPGSEMQMAPSEEMRVDLDDSSRFLHQMGMQTKLDLSDTTARLHGLIEELIANGAVSMRKLEERTERARGEERERTAKQATVHVSPSIDKYSVTDLPDIPCASLLHLCKARCCKLTFALSFQDLDEGVVRWEYGMPYMIRHAEDGYCVHADSQTRRCGVYEKRPLVCRQYDCRKDARVWADWENKVPAPEDATTLITLRRRR